VRGQGFKWNSLLRAKEIARTLWRNRVKEGKIPTSRDAWRDAALSSVTHLDVLACVVAS
jgi:hypothetical protein